MGTATGSLVEMAIEVYGKERATTQMKTEVEGGSEGGSIFRENRWHKIRKLEKWEDKG